MTGNASECKICEITGKIDLSFPCRSKLIQHTHKASGFWTPPTRPEQLKRPELDTSLKVCEKPNYTVYCTSKFYGL